MRLAGGIRGRLGGLWTAAAIVCGVLCVADMSSVYEGWRQALVLGVAAAMTLLLLAMTRAAHRQLEVQA